MGTSVTAISLRRAKIVQRVRNVGKSFEEMPAVVLLNLLLQKHYNVICSVASI